MSRGISNIDTNRVFSSLNNDDVNVNFAGAFPSDKINEFISFDKMMNGRNFSFLISNNDRSNKTGTHWWSVFDIELKIEFFLFDSFGIEGLIIFIIQDAEK